MRTEGIAASTTASQPSRFYLATLTFMACFAAMIFISMLSARAEPLVPEKDELKLGFIKLTDMAPLAIAKEKGFFEDEGLYVTLEPQANWKVLLDGVVSGALRRVVSGDRVITVISTDRWNASSSGSGGFDRGEVARILADPTGWRDVSGVSWLAGG